MQIFAKQVNLNGFEVKNILVWEMVIKKKRVEGRNKENIPAFQLYIIDSFY